MKKIMFSLLGIAAALTLLAPVSWAWQKDSGVSCERVFASIQNDGTLRNWNGVVNANAVDVVTTSGSDNTTNFVTVEWTPTSGFSGPVSATITLSANSSGPGDSNTVSGNLNCPEASPSPTPEVTPSPTPEVTPAPSNQGGPGDGKSDGLGCAVRDCSGNSASQGQVLGASTKAVLGLSTTSGGNMAVASLLQLAAAFGFVSLGFGLFRKHA